MPFLFINLHNTIANLFYVLVRPAFGEFPQHVFGVGAVMMLVGLWWFFARAGGLGLDPESAKPANPAG